MHTIKFLQNIDKPTKWLLLGIVLGLIGIATGYRRSYYYLNQIDKLKSECMAESNKLVPAGATAHLVCDFNTLESLGSSTGIQEEIVDTHRQVFEWRLKGRRIGAALMVIFAIPYAWYFLLRRIRELREAVFGK